MSMKMTFSEIGEIFKNRKIITYNVIREKMNIKNLVLDYIRYKQMNWYGRVGRINEERPPEKKLKWCPL